MLVIFMVTVTPSEALATESEIVDTCNHHGNKKKRIKLTIHEEAEAFYTKSINQSFCPPDWMLQFIVYNLSLQPTLETLTRIQY